ncbi:hypothetical protein, partial [Agrobacterium tomkonis]|uniref:hypothetical protein n=1 Tax=Agrobacterium tomkonis TaxID=1183410 RepID=UPI001CD8B057
EASPAVGEAFHPPFRWMCPHIHRNEGGKGEARSPLVRGASHGAGWLKNGRFAALAVKAGFLADGQAIACLPIGETCGPS